MASIKFPQEMVKPIVERLLEISLKNTKKSICNLLEEGHDPGINAHLNQDNFIISKMIHELTRHSEIFNVEESVSYRILANITLYHRSHSMDESFRREIRKLSVSVHNNYIEEFMEYSRNISIVREVENS